MTNLLSLKLKVSQSQSGYSLIEVILVLVLLSVTTIPMTILLAKQQADIDAAGASTVSQILTNQLFDDVNPRNPLATSAYTISTNTSVTCDPAGKNGGTGAGTQSTCQSTKGPYFQRSVTIQSNNIPFNLIVTVNLYQHQADTVAYFTSSRSYHIDAVNIASSLTSYYVKNTNPITTFEDNLQHFSKNITPFLLPSPVIYYTYSNNGTNSSPFALPDGSSADYCTGNCVHDDVFQVEPMKTYDITLNFVYLQGPSYSPPGDTAEVANIQVIGNGVNGTTTEYQLLQSFNNFDIGSPVTTGISNSWNNDVVVPFHMQVIMPQYDTTLEIKVSPPSSSYNYYFYLKSIKLVERNDT